VKVLNFCIVLGPILCGYHASTLYL